MDKLKSIKEADQNMSKSGIVAVGDISNTTESLSVKKNAIRYHSFVEQFGLDKNKADDLLREGIKIVDKYRSFNLSASLVPHASYSLSPQLIKGIYSYPIPITYNSPSGNSFRKRTFYKLKRRFGRVVFDKGLDISSQLEGGKISTIRSLPYLQKEQSSYWYNTFSESADIEEIETHFTLAYWCTCPKANWYRKTITKL